MLNTHRHLIQHALLAGCLLALATSSYAEILATGQRIWTTEPGQKSTSAYMILTSSRDVVIVSVSSPHAKQAAFFQTVRVGGSLKMRMMDRLALAAGHPVDFTQEGYQLILSGLNHAIKQGDQVSVKLEFMEKDQRIQTVTFTLIGNSFIPP